MLITSLVLSLRLILLLAWLFSLSCYAGAHAAPNSCSCALTYGTSCLRCRYLKNHSALPAWQAAATVHSATLHGLPRTCLVCSFQNFLGEALELSVFDTGLTSLRRTMLLARETTIQGHPAASQSSLTSLAILIDLKQKIFSLILYIVVMFCNCNFSLTRQFTFYKLFL